MIISAITENETVGSWLVEVNELNLSFSSSIDINARETALKIQKIVSYKERYREMCHIVIDKTK